VYQVEAKRLLDDIIAQNKEDKAVISLNDKELTTVERSRGTCGRTISRSSHSDGMSRLTAMLNVD